MSTNNSSTLPDNYNHIESEKNWGVKWENAGIYRWDPKRPRSETFVVDTPPPTVSGALHVGHVFSYTQTDVVTRYQRMQGKNIFYPMGWDDNGLPTERRVQNYFNIRCDPSKKYDPSWKPTKAEDGAKVPPEMVSRRNFIEACSILTIEDEKNFETLWRHLGLSLDWSQQYATIDNHCRKVSQRSFLDLIEKKLCYNVKSPTMWDVDFQSAVAQAELEDREIPGAYHDIEFTTDSGESFVISTTRPELLPACIAVVAHPDDARYKKFFGKTAITPLFHAPVPILPAEHADPEKGSGIMMVCTFGDLMDVEFWKKSKLPLKQIIGLDGRIVPVTFGESAFTSNNPEIAAKNYQQMVGLTVKQAQKKIVELLREPNSGLIAGKSALINEPKPITHPVKFFEKGDRPLEFIPTRQWFINTLEHKDKLIEQGKKVQWHPSHMYYRYESWVQGLNQDWCISRQRYFGVPFPVWYPINKDNVVEFDKPIYAKISQLPVDPSSDVPDGYTEAQRGVAGGFMGDPDVMDTWATSSLTPQIASHWGVDDARHAKLFPADIRPQAHEIIRTWAFSTIVKAWAHHNEIPWKHAIISGWILDPNRKKMSKSKGNTITPQKLLEEYSADAVRYWAAKARLGADTAFDEGIFKIGKKLATKLFNASKFVLMQLDRVNHSPSDDSIKMVTQPLDIALLNRLSIVIESATKSFEAFDYAQSLQTSEEAFWEYCDHYLELVKARSYEETDSAGRQSAIHALSISLKIFLRLLAPFIPYITEEIWSWRFSKVSANSIDSIHTASWPKASECAANNHKNVDELTLPLAIEVISAIRGAKTTRQKSLKWPVSSVEVMASPAGVSALQAIITDLEKGGNVASGHLKLNANPELQANVVRVEVELSE
jgi:valyl-tRNA synthetase